MKKNTSLQKITKQVEETTLESLQSNQEMSDIKEVTLAIGAISGLRLVSRFTGISTIKLLQEIRDKQKYIAFGYSRFEDFLSEDLLVQKYVGISYKTFNNLENQLKAEGEDIYELLNNMRVPLSTRRNLFLNNDQVDIAIDGDKLQIGDEEVSLEDVPKVKELLKEMALQTKVITEKHSKSQETIKNLETRVSQGQQEFNELQRAMVAQNEGTPYEQSLSRLINAFVRFNDQIEELPLTEKVDKSSALDTLWLLIEESRKRFGSNKSFTDTTATATVSELTKKVFAEDDDLED